MRLATIQIKGGEFAGIVTEKGIVPIEEVNATCGTSWETLLYESAPDSWNL